MSLKAFINDLLNLSKCSQILPSDIHNLIALNNASQTVTSYNINAHGVITQLCRDNMSMTKISPESV